MRILFAAFFFVLVFTVPAMADNVIGTVIELEGTATLNSAPTALDAEVRPNDVIETGANSRVMILFIDDTQMVLSEKTKMSIDEYVFDPDNNAANKSVYSILQGIFVYTSGLIAKKENPDVLLKTRVGAIGVRGTEFWGGDIDGEYGVLVDEGEVEVTTDAGAQRIKKGEGSMVKGRAFKPGQPKIWPEEKTARARQAVFLKRREFIRHRIATQKAKHQTMREKYREFLRQRRGLPKEEHMEQRQENLQDLREKGLDPQQQKIQDRLQERREGLKQETPPVKPQLREKAQQLRQQRQERR